MQKQILLVIVSIIITIGLIEQADAGTFKYDTFGYFDGNYLTKNGYIDTKGTMTATNSIDTTIRLVGHLKEWNYIDTSIPNCKHAFADDFTIIFTNVPDTRYAKLILIGKTCKMNWSGQWLMFQGNYIIIEGKVFGTDEIAGKGIISFLINTQTSKIVGTLKGNIILYT